MAKPSAKVCFYISVMGLRDLLTHFRFFKLGNGFPTFKSIIIDQFEFQKMLMRDFSW